MNPLPRHHRPVQILQTLWVKATHGRSRPILAGQVTAKYTTQTNPTGFALFLLGWQFKNFQQVFAHKAMQRIQFVGIFGHGQSLGA